jgi:hypothetical protein
MSLLDPQHGHDYERLMRQSALVRGTHVVMGAIVAVIYEGQRDFSHYAFWRSSGWGIVVILLVPLWPYAISCINVWRRNTTRWARPWIFCVVMVLITVLVCLYYLSPLNREYGLYGTALVTIMQFNLFRFFVSWTFEKLVDEY